MSDWSCNQHTFKTGTPDCCSFVVAYFHPATSIDRLHLALTSRTGTVEAGKPNNISANNKRASNTHSHRGQRKRTWVTTRRTKGRTTQMRISSWSTCRTGYVLTRRTCTTSWSRLFLRSVLFRPHSLDLIGCRVLYETVTVGVGRMFPCDLWNLTGYIVVVYLTAGGETHREASTTKYKTDWIQFSASLHVKHLVVDLSVWMTFLSTGFEWIGSALHITRCDMWQWTVCRWHQRLCFHCKECLEENKRKKEKKKMIESLFCVAVLNL